MWRGDLQLAKATLERIPPSTLQDDVIATNVFIVYLWLHESQNSLFLLNGVPREWLSSPPFEGPKTFLLGMARLMAEQTELAQRDFQRALDLIEKHLAVDPNNLNLLGLKAEALFYLHERAEAERTYLLVRELSASRALELGPAATQAAAATDLLFPMAARSRELFESQDAVIDNLESTFEENWSLTAAGLRLEPIFETLRTNPRFVKLLARAEADPRKSPIAAAPAVATPALSRADSPDGRDGSNSKPDAK